MLLFVLACLSRMLLFVLACLFVVFVAVVIYKPIIPVLVCFLDLIHDFVRDIFHCLRVRGGGDDIEWLLVSAHIFVFFNDFVYFCGHFDGRHLFVVEIVITR